jgi:mannose-6-phosphate isomerase-like protein (cupin superfamily)
MTIIDVMKLAGTRFPAGRVTRALVGGNSVVADRNFKLGYVVLDPDGGQVPWHNHEPEEVYFVLSGKGEICVDGERAVIESNQMVHMQPNQFHQLTNIGSVPLVMLYCGPCGLAMHSQQELSGSLPRAGLDVPSLPAGSRPQKA